MADLRPIGIFDSGVGGLSVLREIRNAAPTESLRYVADQQWAPYGRLTIEQVRERALSISGRLIDEGAKAVVVACNSASAAALHRLRAQYESTPFIGLEPAVKPAALQSRTGVVGVLATSATFQGELFNSVVDRHAANVTVVPVVGTGLADLVERDRGCTDEARELLASHLRLPLDEGMDILVLGCTHYPFLIDDIRAVVGDGVEIIDPAPAVARQVVHVLAETGMSAGDAVAAYTRYVTTKDPDRLGHMIERLLGAPSDSTPTSW